MMVRFGVVWRNLADVFEIGSCLVLLENVNCNAAKLPLYGRPALGPVLFLPTVHKKVALLQLFADRPHSAYEVLAK